MRRVLLAVFLAGLVALAGCGGSGTTTAPTTGGTTGQTAATALPPGVTDAGITNASALVQAHVDALNGTAYAFGLDATSSRSDTVYRTHFSGATDGDETVLRQNASGARVDLYVSGDYAMQRQSTGSATQYRVLQGAIARQQASSLTNVQRVVLTTYLRAGNYTVTGTTTRDGTEYVELTATTANASSDLTRNVEAFEATVLVTPDGRVDEFTTSITTNQSGTTTTTEFTYRVTDVGSADPSEPGWTSEVPQVTASVSADGTALVLENTGGSALPAGASFTVTAGNRTGEITVQERLAAGDTVYVTATADGQQLNATVTRGQPDTGGVDLSTLDRVSVTGRTGGVTFQLVVESQN